MAIIVVSKHRTQGLQDALVVLREWNSYWNPKYFMLDYSDHLFKGVVAAITTVFPGNLVDNVLAEMVCSLLLRKLGFWRGIPYWILEIL